MAHQRVSIARFGLVAMALCLTLSLWGQGPQRSPATVTSETTSDNRGAVSSPIVVEVATPEKRDTRPPEEKKNELHQAGDEARIADATVALAWITGALALFTALLWIATLRLAKDAKRTSDRQAAETKDSLALATRAADTASANVATLVAAERAYVFAELHLEAFVNALLQGPSENFGAVRVRVKFWNYGKTVAVITKIRGYITTLESVPHEMVAFEGSERELPPQIGIGANCAHEEVFESKFDVRDFTDLKNWNKRVFVVGRMEYRTILDKECITGFCWHVIFGDVHSSLTLTRESKLNVRS